MSSGGQIVGGIIGAVVGFFASGYNPVGAFQGFAIGAGIGGYLDPPKGPNQEGPRLNDKTVQTSTYGATIPRIYGTCKIAGNVFWLEGDQLKERARKESSGGKGGGGGSATVKTYTYYATFAVGLCRGPIAGVRRIWIGPDLIFDAGSDNIESIVSSNANSKKFTLYLGTEDQLPDSRIQADKGVANTPAYRGLAYIIIKDFELTKYGNNLAQAQVQVEVVKSQDANVIQLMEDNYGVINVFQTLGGADKSAVIRYQAEKPDGIYSVSYTNGVRREYQAVSVDAYDQIVPVLSTTTETYAYFYTDSSVPGNAILDISGELFYLPGGFDQSPVARSNKDAMLQSSTGLHFTSNDEMQNIIIQGTKTAKKLINSGFSASYATYANGVAYILQSHDLNTFDVYTMDVNESTASFSLIANVPKGTSYGINENGYWRTTSPGGGSGSIYQYDFSFNLIFEVPINITASIYTRSFNNSIIVADTSSIFNDRNVYAYAVQKTENTAALSEIVTNESLLSKILSESDVDASELADAVYGYRVSNIGSIRNGIEPLRGAWPFDVIQNGYAIRFRPRGTASVATIDVGELGVENQIQEVREMDSQIPRKVIVKHIDRARDYDPNEQYSQRDNVDSVNTLNLDLPVVLTPIEAKQVTEKLLYLYWLERSDFTFTLPPTYQYLQPSDVVTINADDVSYSLRLTNIKYMQDGSLECSGKPNNAAVYTSIADADGGLTPPGTVPLFGVSVGVLVDAPIIDETMQNAPGFSAFMTGFAGGWPGGTLFSTNDNGQNWNLLQAFSGKGTFGSASTPLSANAGTNIEKGGSLLVSLLSGSLESITEDQMKNGRNYAAYGVDGRWEIIRFQNATLNADGTYTLDTFIRGDRGTEWATGLHQAGDSFVLMDDPDGAWIGQPTSSIGVPYGYRAITSGANIDSANTDSFTYNGVNLETYSPVHGSGSRDGSGNLTISWIRRTRIGGEWRSNVDASLGETSESYEIDIMNGSSVVRTLTSNSESVIYSAANQTSDFGSPQASVTARIYQMSSVVGRGQPLEVTV